MLTPEGLFNTDEQQRLADAVRNAERGTSGEIVPYVVGRSDSYPEAPWRAGALLGFLVLFGFSAATLATDVWLPWGISEVVLFAAGAFLAGAAVTLAIPRLRMMFVPASVEQQRVGERAAMAFLAEEVFATRDRTGILIFLSLLERRVQILADSGITAKVRQDEWDDIARTIVDGMKRRRAADALEQAIGKCGTLLAAHGVAIRPDDTNELDNAVRLSDR